MKNPANKSKPNGLTIIGAFLVALVLVFGLQRTIEALAQEPAPLETVEVAADPFDVITKRVQGFFTELRSLRARFVQLSPDGALSYGMFSLLRPGLLRFDYDPPATLQIVADGEYLYITDTALNDTTRWDINETPLTFLLSDDVQVGRDIDIKEAISDQGILTVTLYDEERANEGAIKLIFIEEPFELKQWMIIDAQDQVTTLVLEDTEINGPMNADVFELRRTRTPGRPGS